MGNAYLLHQVFKKTVLEKVGYYGVKINTANPNSETAVTYIGDSIGYTPARGNNGSFTYGSWQTKFPFNQIKPCMFKNGTVQYYLNPNDYTKKIDGSTANITTGGDGDVMIEFPKIYWKFERIGTDLYVKYSDLQLDEGYKCLAHTRGTTEKDKIYIAAYLGQELSDKLRSVSGRTPTTGLNIGVFRNQARNNGTGYDQISYYQLLMMQVLYLVMFKNLDSQTALGRGYVDGNTTVRPTGVVNTRGMFYGLDAGNTRLKFCGVEDFYGNLLCFIDGLITDSNRNVLIANNNFNVSGTGYVNYGQASTVDIEGYITDVLGGTETGFIVKNVSDNSAIYYSDYGYLQASKIALFGGRKNDAQRAGAFSLNINYGSYATSENYGARLMFV